MGVPQHDAGMLNGNLSEACQALLGLFVPMIQPDIEKGDDGRHARRKRLHGFQRSYVGRHRQKMILPDKLQDRAYGFVLAGDQEVCRRGYIREDQIRSLTAPLVVDTGAVMLVLPRPESPFLPLLKIK